MPVPSTSEIRIQKVQEAKVHIDRQLHELAAEMAQCPTLTRIAGFRQWNRLGRRMKAGEKDSDLL